MAGKETKERMSESLFVTVCKVLVRWPFSMTLKDVAQLTPYQAWVIIDESDEDTDEDNWVTHPSREAALQYMASMRGR